VSSEAMRSRAAILSCVVAVAASVIVPGTATPQTTLPAEVASSRRNAIVTALEKVSPAVVSITVVQRKIVEEYEPFLSPFFEPFLSPFRRRVVEVAGIGSGVIFDDQGHILTNEHVVRDARKIIVKLPDGRWGPGTVLGADRRADVALVQINEEELQMDTKRDSREDGGYHTCSSATQTTC